MAAAHLKKLTNKYQVTHDYSPTPPMGLRDSQRCEIISTAETEYFVVNKGVKKMARGVVARRR